MNSLPFELYYHIFEHLNLEDLLNLRLVCAKFNYILRGFKIKELVFYDKDFRANCFKSNWFYSNQSINFKNVIDTSRLRLLKSSFFNINLRRLKIIHLNGDCKINLKGLDKFCQLENFEIETDLHYLINRRLSSKSLKILKIKLTKLNRKCSNFFEINCPILEALDLNCDLNVYLKINCLSTIKYLSSYSYLNYFSIFKNLEHLKLYRSTELNWNVISRFSKLKELHVHIDRSNSLADIQQNCALNKLDLKIYKKGLLAINGETFDYDKQDTLTLLMDNYSKTSDCLDFVCTIDYVKLMNLFDYYLPANFFMKLNNIHEILVYNKIEDQAYLIQFIEECSNLNKLSIERSSLTQDFYDNLASVSSLNHLAIHRQIGLNFKFITKMRSLISFKTDQKLTLNKAFNFNRYDYLKKIEFKIKNKVVRIEKLACEYRYNLLIGDYFIRKDGIKFIEIVKSCNQI